MRPSNRKFDQLRDIEFELDVSKHAEGSCLVSFGNTQVICTASVDENVPNFIKNTGKGWITAEYSMLPRATGKRNKREITLGKPNGRVQEIQRFIARSLRSSMTSFNFGERQIIIDCDVINADGGTRTASICGGYVALVQAIKHLKDLRIIKSMPIMNNIAAISCGIYQENIILDLDYIEDSEASVDANFVMSTNNRLIEIQVCGEKKFFDQDQLLEMMNYAKKANGVIIDLQNQILNKIGVHE